MGKTLDKSNLGYLGIDFQYKLVKYFVEDHNFFEEVYDIIDQNAFSDINLRIFVGTLKDIYKKENIAPSYSTIELVLRSKANDEYEIKEWEELIEKLKKTSYEGSTLVKENALKFFKQQKLIKAANKILEKVGKGDIEQYEECLKIMEDALSTGNAEDYGKNIFDLEEKALSDDYTVSVSTGISGLDEALGGGLDKGKFGLIIGPLGFGKALADDENVVTPDGYKQIKELKVGDYVIGSNGKSCKILGVYPQGERDIYKVTFSDKTSCRCDKEHLWNVNSLKQRRHRTRVNGKRFSSPDYSFKTMTLSDILNEGLVKDGMRNFRIPITKPVEFEEKELKINPYLMGYFLGDGTFSRNAITCGKQDIGNCVEELKKCGEEFTVSYYDNRNIYCLNFKKTFKDNIHYYFNENHVSDNKFVPHDFKYNTIENRIALLNGLMDSDGTSQKNGTSCFNTKSKQLALDVRDIVLSLGGFATIREKKTGYNYKGNYVDCGIQYECTITLTDESIPIFRFERKQKRVKYRKKYKDCKYIDKVEYVGKQNAICIKVDSEDELFLTNDYIVTHNTTLATAMASAAATTRCEQNNNQGWKVVQIYFEDDDVDITRKHFSRLVDKEAREFKRLNKDDRKVIFESLEHHPDRELLSKNLRIKSFRTGEKSATDIKNWLIKLTNKGFKPDLVIIDYFECLAPERDDKSKDKWESEGITARKIEGMAKELDIAIWCPTQGSRDSILAEIVTVDKGGGSIKKSQVAQVIISIARTLEDRENNRATLALLKNRSGLGTKIFKNIKFDNGRSIVVCDEVEELDSLKQWEEEEKKINQRNQEEMVMQLHQKY